MQNKCIKVTLIWKCCFSYFAHQLDDWQQKWMLELFSTIDLNMYYLDHHPSRRRLASLHALYKSNSVCKSYILVIWSSGKDHNINPLKYPERFMDLSMLVGNPSKELILRERKAKHYNYDTALVGKLDSNAFKHAYSESRGRLFPNA